jgi:AcrR family transcriptional regulator
MRHPPPAGHAGAVSDNGEVPSVSVKMHGPRAAGRPPLAGDELARRKRAILDVTLSLVAAKGADAVRLRDVACEAGVSAGLLQYYFDSRDQLIRDAFDQHARAVIDAVTMADDPVAPPWARLEAMFGAVMLRPDLGRSSALWMEFTSASLHDEQLRMLLKGTYEAWRALLAEIVARGIETEAFRPSLPPELVVSCLVALIDGFELAVAIDVHDATPAGIREKLTGTARLLLNSTGDS